MSVYRGPGNKREGSTLRVTYCNVFRTFIVILILIFSCSEHSLITALADGFTLIKCVYINILARANRAIVPI